MSFRRRDQQQTRESMAPNDPSEAGDTGDSRARLTRSDSKLRPQPISPRKLPFTSGQLTYRYLKPRDVKAATHEILNLIQMISKGTTIYFDGWDGFGTRAVFRSMVQVLQSMKDPCPELCFDRIMYIDCSTWKSKRVMQKKITEELNLEHKTKAMFDKEDEEDDYNKVDPTSRDAIQDVAKVIDQTLRNSIYIVIFLNGSDQEVDLSTLGMPKCNSIIIWTFKRRFPIEGLFCRFPISDIQMLPSKLRNTSIFLFGLRDYRDQLKGSEVSALVREEASTIHTHNLCMQDNDRAMVNYCYLYGLFLHHTFHKGASRHWAAHGANYWICDGIIEGDRTREISEALYPEVSFEFDANSFFKLKEVKREIMLHPDSQYLVWDGDDDSSWMNPNKSPCWISVTSNNKIFGDSRIKGMLLARASTIILVFESTSGPQELPNDLMEHCNNLKVLILSNCAFNFLSPPFRYCPTLRFLGLDHCTNNYTAQLLEREEYISNSWAFLHSLWVLDLYYTDWDEILSKDNMDFMINIIELNIEGSICWQYIGHLMERLHQLQRLRIVKPVRQANSSVEIVSSFMGKTKLEVLDLSGNKDMKELPTSISKASNLQVLVLDGCVELENVALSNSILRSFSFDGYGPSSYWTSMDEFPPEAARPKCPSNVANNKKVETSLIHLQGCTQLNKLFLRGLGNLIELNLSGCAIKILDFETMVVDVPRLKRLFLLGCEQLCAIKWGTLKTQILVHLELLCIDTRSGDCVPRHTWASIVDKKFGLKVHAITADARLARSFYVPIFAHDDKVRMDDTFFDIRITSLCAKKNSKENHVMVASVYNDAYTKVGDSFLTPMQTFPHPPVSQLDRHIEIGDGSRNVGSEMRMESDHGNLFFLMANFVQSLHVHDTWTTIAMPSMVFFRCIKWCRVERCPRLNPVFPPYNDPCDLETIWASDLLKASCIWSKGRYDEDSQFGSLQHLHLRSCPSLQFGIPIWTSSFPMLESLHIIHCGSLRHVFELDNKEFNINNSSILFPKLTIIRLHDVPALHYICEVKMMVAPNLEIISTRRCWNLRRLPALGQLKAGSERRRPTVELMEKDVWDALEWDGVDVGHHPYLYKAPVHSRYYKGRRLLRGTALSLRHVFELDNKEFNINNSSIFFPKLTIIRLHDVPALHYICEVKMMITPNLEIISARGCWNLRRLPALGQLKASSERRRPTVELMEKDVWDALEWDGVDVGHHSSLYKTPVHSRYYKGRRLLRGTALR